ncbi:hypothetical protein [Pseudomonas amygdali]|uniref:hypothetical protein n=1 Tax=Pseudomonas amygdali TaxID=47877 RepID=UPI000F3E220E|nr:hypothetical protein [Pseudomonas amygdali]RMV75481.1 hypothetical protein ALP04_00599 [Pseudomonas amygdali pv. sesami]
MSKHPIPDWLRSQFSRIEDEAQKLGPCGVFTQMRTVTQTYFEQQAEAAQPPALDGVPAGLDLQRIVTEALMGMIAAVTSTSPPANEPPPPFIQAGIDRAVSRIIAHLAPLQAEITRLKSEDEIRQMVEESLRLEIDQLKARCDELEVILKEASEWFDDGVGRSDEEWSLLVRIKAALSKPAGSEKV